MRLICIYGCDHFHHVSVPDDLDLQAAQGRYRSWGQNEYLPALRANNGYHPPGFKFLDFCDFLIEREGCTRGVIETYDEEDNE